MPSTAGASGAANDARVQTGLEAPVDAQQRQRELLADEAEQAVEVIAAKLDGMQQALAAKQAEAEQLRADADAAPADQMDEGGRG